MPNSNQFLRFAALFVVLLVPLGSNEAYGQEDTMSLSLSAARQIALSRSAVLAGDRYRLHAAEADTMTAHLFRTRSFP